MTQTKPEQEAAGLSLSPPQRVWRRQNVNVAIRYRLCTLPAIIVMLLVAVLPLLRLFTGSLTDQGTGAFTLQYYQSTLSNAYFMRVLSTTLLMALFVTVVAIVLAFPTAYVLARKTALRNIMMPAITIPRMLPFVVIGYAMILLLAPFTGVFNKVLMTLGIIDAPLFILFDWPGQAIAFIYGSMIVATAILTGVLMGVDPQLEDAAVSMGASKLSSIVRITLPLSSPGIIAASALIFTSTITSYAIPVMLSGRVPYMISVIIANNLLTLQQNHLAYAQAVIVTVIAISVTATSQIILSRYGSRRA